MIMPWIITTMPRNMATMPSSWHDHDHISAWSWYDQGRIMVWQLCFPTPGKSLTWFFAQRMLGFQESAKTSPLCHKLIKHNCNQLFYNRCLRRSRIFHLSSVIQIIPPFFVSEASSGRSEAVVATKPPIVPISIVSRFVFVFFIFSAKFRDNFRNFLNAYISEPRRKIGNILKTPGRMTKIKQIRKLAENFRPTWFLCRNILKFGNLTTAFTNFHALLLVTHRPMDICHL